MIIDSLLTYGASVRGPYHVSAKANNQDAWAKWQGHSLSVIAVCDGLGSKSKSDIGSKAACKSSIHAARIWSNFPNADVEHFPRLVNLLWKMEISQQNPSDFATTCLTAFFSRSGKLVISGLGDGIAVVRKPDGEIISVVLRHEGFSNETQGLGVPHQLSDWNNLILDNISAGTTVLLATDGVSDDLDPNTISEFIAWLKHVFSPLPAFERYQALRRELSNWPTPKHQDDKTIAVMEFAAR